MHLLFLDGGHRHARPASDNVFDVVLADRRGHRLVDLLPLLEVSQVLPLLALLVRVESRLLEFVIGDGVLHAMHDELDPFVDLGALVRHLRLLQLDPRTRFVKQVDGLVREEPVRNVADRAEYRRFHRRIGVDDRVELLVALLDADQYLDGLLLRRRADFDGLEASL